jgi:hypothetical protein
MDVLGLEGSKVIEPWNLIKATTLTTTKTSISNAKKIPAILVDIETPRIIMTTANAKNTNVHTIHGTFSRPETL